MIFLSRFCGRYRLLCAEREDKKGDRWSKEMQGSREAAFKQKRNESLAGVGNSQKK